MANTEKPIAKAEQKKSRVIKTKKEKLVGTSKVKMEKSNNLDKKEEALINKEISEDKKSLKSEKEIKKPVTEVKKQIPKPKIKKDSAVVKGISLPISTKDSIAVCNFIKYKTIDNALSDLKDVLERKKFIPMKGEIPHRKGSGKIGSGSGRYPEKTIKYFVRLLKSIKANSENNELEEPIINLAFANKASRPFGRFGKTKKKRTNIKVVVKEKKDIKLKNKNGRKKSN